MSLRLRRVLVVLVGTVVCSVMVFLGLWQMDVFRSQGRQSAEEIAKQPPVALAEHLTDGTDASSVFGHQVTLSGKFLPDQQFHAGTTYPLRVVTAFQTDGGQIVAVVRGVSSRPKDPVPRAAEQHLMVTGVILPSENDPNRDLPGQDLPPDTLAKIRLPQVAQFWPSPMVNGYVTLNAADAQSQGLTAAAVVLPELQGRARNGGYALQWWVFAGAALVFSVVVARSLKEADSGRAGPDLPAQDA